MMREQFGTGARDKMVADEWDGVIARRISQTLFTGLYSMSGSLPETMDMQLP